MLCDKDIPHKYITIYDGFRNWCTCGLYGAVRTEFIAHLNEHHKSLILNDSQLNSSQWIDWIRYRNDFLEEEVFTTLSNLNKYS